MSKLVTTRSHRTPPRLAEWLLRRRLPGELAEPVLGDLAERFHALSQDDPAGARRFYWRQTRSAFARRLRPTPSATERATAQSPATASGLDSWAQDLRYGVRRLARSPGFTLVALLTLALGISATTTIFSVVQETLLRSLPFSDPDRLVMVWNHTRDEPTDRWLLTAKDFADLDEQGRSLDVAAVTETVVGPMLGAGKPVHVKISRTTANFFSLLGVEPVLGRGFRPQDGTPVAAGDEEPPLPILLSYGTWQTHFGAERDVLGRTMTIFGRPAEVIGVMPADFKMHLPDAAGVGREMDLWWPIRTDHSQGARDSHYLTVVARIDDGASLGEARAEIASFAQGVRQVSARHEELGLDFELAPLAADVVAHVRPTLVFLSGAVGFVLLIACANVASLFLVRGARRRSELTVMSALGASRWRLVRQLLTESLLLGVAGGVGGLLLASVGLEMLKRLRPTDLPWVDAVQLDPGIVAFALGTSLLAALVYGVAPALRSTMAAGRLGQRGSGGSAGESRLRSSLVVLEVALSLVLLVGAGLMMRTFGELNRVQLGFDPENLLVVDVSMPGQLDREQRLQVVHDVERALQSLPGVGGRRRHLPRAAQRRLRTDLLLRSRRAAPRERRSAGGLLPHRDARLLRRGAGVAARRPSARSVRRGRRAGGRGGGAASGGEDVAGARSHRPATLLPDLQPPGGGGPRRGRGRGRAPGRAGGRATDDLYAPSLLRRHGDVVRGALPGGSDPPGAGHPFRSARCRPRCRWTSVRCRRTWPASCVPCSSCWR